MDALWIVVAASLVMLALGIGLVVSGRRRAGRRTAAMRRQFGPEYDHVVADFGGRARGEAELAARLHRRRELSLRRLDDTERERFEAAWQEALVAFVDTPTTGLREADLLVMQAMRKCGYPVEHFEERARLVSVDYPELVAQFRAAHLVAASSESGSADTEEMRQALVDYRFLFDELLGGGDVDRPLRS